MKFSVSIHAVFVGVGLSLMAAAMNCSKSDNPTTNSTSDAASGSSAPSGQPNILFVLADDQRADSAQCMAKLHSLIGSNGVNFSLNFAATPLCCPGRSSILTGKYAHNHGVITNGDINEGATKVNGAEAFKDKGNEQLAFVKWLQAAGYRTALFGKYLNGYENQTNADENHDGKPDNYIPPYWDDWFAFPSPDYFNFQLVQRAHTDTETKRVCYSPADGTGPTNATGSTDVATCKKNTDSFDNSQENYATDVLKNHAINFIKTAAADKKPFFAYFAMYSPHAPYQSPSRYQVDVDSKKASFTEAATDRLKDCSLFDWNDRPKSFLEDDMTDKPEWIQANVAVDRKNQKKADFDIMRKKQLVSVLATEDALEEMMAVLESTGQKNNTLIVYSADNGYAWGEHWYGTKNCAYEECSRVPLIVYDPRAPQGGTTFPGMILNVDIAPTVAEWAGVKIPDGTLINGMSFANIASGKSTTWSRDRVLTECWGDEKGKAKGLVDTHASARTTKWKYIEHYVDEARTAIKTRQDGKAEIELYDLENDPYELDNLSIISDAQLTAKGLTRASEQAAEAEMKAKLLQLEKD